MSNPIERAAEDAYESENDPSPVPDNEIDNSYTTDYANTKVNDPESQVPVIADDAPVEDPVVPFEADTDEQLRMNPRSPHE